jgi:hypothetical protein
MMALVSASPLVKELEALGLSAREEWLSHCVRDGGGRSGPALLEHVVAQLLAADLRAAAGQPTLPAGAAETVKGRLAGAFVLQVDELVDVARRAADRAPDTPAGPHRALKARLTDGFSALCALEYDPIPTLSPSLPLGTKLLVACPVVRRGLLLLTAENTTVLGGGVRALDELRAAATGAAAIGRAPAPPAMSTPAAGAGAAATSRALMGPVPGAPGMARAPGPAGAPQLRPPHGLAPGVPLAQALGAAQAPAARACAPSATPVAPPSLAPLRPVAQAPSAAGSGPWPRPPSGLGADAAGPAAAFQTGDAHPPRPPTLAPAQPPPPPPPQPPPQFAPLPGRAQPLAPPTSADSFVPPFSRRAEPAQQSATLQGGGAAQQAQWQQAQELGGGGGASERAGRPSLGRKRPVVPALGAVLNPLLGASELPAAAPAAPWPPQPQPPPQWAPMAQPPPRAPPLACPPALPLQSAPSLATGAVAHGGAPTLAAASPQPPPHAAAPARLADLRSDVWRAARGGAPFALRIEKISIVSYGFSQPGARASEANGTPPERLYEFEAELSAADCAEPVRGQLAHALVLELLGRSAGETLARIEGGEPEARKATKRALRECVVPLCGAVCLAEMRGQELVVLAQKA